MNDTEVRFLEEYKSTDALCMDIHGCGISDYIRAIEDTADEYAGVIDGWKDTYYSLKHLRWLRNRITHDTGVSECCEKDIKAIRAFRSALTNGSDPAALANKRSDACKARGGGQTEGWGASALVAVVAVLAAVLVLIFAIHSCV